MFILHRPNDSRMVMALGDTYEKLDRLQEAKKCYWKAHSIGDIEGQALVKLAKYVARYSLIITFVTYFWNMSATKHK